jgi:hypothetical protein
MSSIIYSLTGTFVADAEVTVVRTDRANAIAGAATCSRYDPAAETDI